MAEQESQVPETPAASVETPKESTEKRETKLAEQEPAEKKEPVVAAKVPATPPTPPAAATPVPKAKKSETLERIEDIMEEDLKEVYSHLTPEKKQEFRKKGEETAEEIEGMLFRVKIHSKKVFGLLFGWLKIIPGVNRYFLKQEAKLKTDEIMDIKEDLDRAKHGSMDM